MAPAPRPIPEGGFNFTHEHSVFGFNVPAATFLASRPLVRGAATGALVFTRATGEERVLIVQRAAHDSMPLRWEIPGGACDPEDETVLHGLARELWEEAGLKLKRVVRQVGDEFTFLTRRGLAVARVTFEVEVETPTVMEDGVEMEDLPDVTLDPNEHSSFLWATEEQCRTGKVAVMAKKGEPQAVDLNFTTKEQQDVILEGFKLRKEETTTTSQ